jgi:type IV secretory pathway protease TraF
MVFSCAFVRLPQKKGRIVLKKKIALFYVLITSLCLISLVFVLLHSLGYRVNRSDSLPGSRLYVNNRIMEITVASEDSRDGRLFAYPTPISLPPGWYWLASDPERGFDSRYFGPLPREAFTHRAEAVF